MNLQKFKQTYTRVISESSNERELKNYIRSIVEEMIEEVKGTAAINNLKTYLGNEWKSFKHKDLDPKNYILVLKNGSSVIAISKEDEDGDVNWLTADLKETGKLNVFESGNDSLEGAIKAIIDMFEDSKNPSWMGDDGEVVFDTTPRKQNK